MKPLTVVFSPFAEQYLDDIWWYIAQASQEIEIADAFHEKLVDYCFDTLAYIPDTGTKQDDILGIEGIRMSPIAKYNVFYRTENNELQIIRILRSSRDYPKLFDSHHK